MVLTGAELRALYGTPEWLGPRGEHTCAWRHKSEESARAFAEANGADGAALFEDGYWISTVDLTRKIAELNAAYQETYTLEIYPSEAP